MFHSKQSHRQMQSQITNYHKTTECRRLRSSIVPPELDDAVVAIVTNACFKSAGVTSAGVTSQQLSFSSSVMQWNELENKFERPSTWALTHASLGRSIILNFKFKYGLDKCQWVSMCRKTGAVVDRQMQQSSNEQCQTNATVQQWSNARQTQASGNEAIARQVQHWEMLDKCKINYERSSSSRTNAWVTALPNAWV